MRRSEKGWEVLLLQHRNGGHWTFPKGHAEKEEHPLQTAKRELQEETGLTVSRLLKKEMLKENYSYQHQGKTHKKKVGYFVAEVAGMLSVQKEEIFEGAWFSFDEAMQQITFPESLFILKTVFSDLNH